MTKSKTTSSFRFDNDFIDLLDTWAFVTKKEKGVLLQDAFREYIKMEHNSNSALKVDRVIESLKEKEQEG
jgi:predicted transcriptional regulator